MGVVYANGDVTVRESHPPLGNLRQKSFFEIWDSEEADALRAQIKAKQCYCTSGLMHTMGACRRRAEGDHLLGPLRILR